MKESNIKFVKPTDDMIYKPEKRIESFYQICQFKNNTDKYSTRKIIFNEQGNILKAFEREYSGKKLEEFIKQNKTNKYKIYPTNDISFIDMPSGEEMICVCSELL